MVLKIINWQMKEIYQIILELASRKNQMGHSNYRNCNWWGKLSTISDLQCP